MRILQVGCLIAVAFAVNGPCYGSLIAWYDFDNSGVSGVVTDNSGNGHTGTILGSAAFATPNAGGPSYLTGAMTFNGGSDGVSLNITGTAHPFTELTSAGTNAVTVSFWEYGDSTQPDSQFAFFANGTGGRAISSHAPWSDGVVYFDTAGCCNGNQRLTSPGSVPASDYTGQWNQYTLTKDASGNKDIYINGTLIASSTGNLNIDAITDFIIGNDDAASGQNLGYHGQLSDFAIFNSALTQTQVNELVEFGPGFFTPEPRSALALCGLGAMGLLVALRWRPQCAEQR